MNTEHPVRDFGGGQNQLSVSAGATRPLSSLLRATWPHSRWPRLILIVFKRLWQWESLCIREGRGKWISTIAGPLAVITKGKFIRSFTLIDWTRLALAQNFKVKS